MENKRVLVTGITSIHGWPIFSRLQGLLPSNQLYGIRPPKMAVPDGPNVESLCITNRARMQAIRDKFRPTHVVHCAGVCDLDVCEARPAWARALNVGGSRIIADVFGKNAYILFMSTDLVFSGNHPPAGGYAEIHPPDPLSVAGKTFSEAERQIQRCPNHCIVRLGLPLGDSVTGAKGAVDWIESRFKRQLPVTLFHDELRSCVSCAAIGEMALALLNDELQGLYHFGGEHSWTLHEIGRYVIDKGNYPPELLTGILRHEEQNGPPRIGDVSLNSSRLSEWLASRRRLMH
ncbi:sugar nucleotide-binding protein [candidate division KSB1 bacterium]|nr:sugar nucleotide-binding protein [candidate division KSB1 bacterium]